MQHSHILSACALCALAACGGTSSGGDFVQTRATVIAPTEVTGIQRLRDEADRLSSDIAGLVPTDAADLPASGTARYDGVAAFGFLTESSLGIGVGGDLEMTIGLDDLSVNGTIDNFYSRDGDAREGTLTLRDGFVMNGPGAAAVGAQFDGALDLFGGDPVDVTGALFGPFVGQGGSHIAGQAALQLVQEPIAETEPLIFEGAFTAEKVQ